MLEVDVVVVLLVVVNVLDVLVIEVLMVLVVLVDEDGVVDGDVPCSFRASTSCSRVASNFSMTVASKPNPIRYKRGTTRQAHHMQCRNG